MNAQRKAVAAEKKKLAAEKGLKGKIKKWSDWPKERRENSFKNEAQQISGVLTGPEHVLTMT